MQALGIDKPAPAPAMPVVEPETVDTTGETDGTETDKSTAEETDGVDTTLQEDEIDDLFNRKLAGQAV